MTNISNPLAQELDQMNDGDAGRAADLSSQDFGSDPASSASLGLVSELR